MLKHNKSPYMLYLCVCEIICISHPWIHRRWRQGARSWWSVRRARSCTNWAGTGSSGRRCGISEAVGMGWVTWLQKWGLMRLNTISWTFCHPIEFKSLFSSVRPWTIYAKLPKICDVPGNMTTLHEVGLNSKDLWQLVDVADITSETYAGYAVGRVMILVSVLIWLIRG